MNANQQAIIIFSEAIISSYAKLLFTETPEVSVTAAESKTEIADAVTSAKSNIPKDENELVPLIIFLEFQVAYPDCK
jgi:hypothetical protein